MDENINQYFGYIKIVNVENIKADSSKMSDENDNSSMLSIDHIKFVQYPDCQQLIIWLPESSRYYETISLLNTENNTEVWNQKIDDIVQGSVQMIFDSSVIPPGTYKILIIKSDGLHHVISLMKSSDYKPALEVKSEQEIEIDLDKPPIIYRDGLGNILPNEDLILRDELITKTFNKIMREVKYENQGRGGYAIFIEGFKSIKFEMEYGGGDCIFIVYIPSKEKWEAQTDFPLEEREDIVTFVADRVLRDQTSSSNAYYKISETDIAYFNK